MMGEDFQVRRFSRFADGSIFPIAEPGAHQGEERNGGSRASADGRAPSGYRRQRRLGQREDAGSEVAAQAVPRNGECAVALEAIRRQRRSARVVDGISRARQKRQGAHRREPAHPHHRNERRSGNAHTHQQDSFSGARVIRQYGEGVLEDHLPQTESAEQDSHFEGREFELDGR